MSESGEGAGVRVAGCANRARLLRRLGENECGGGGVSVKAPAPLWHPLACAGANSHYYHRHDGRSPPDAHGRDDPSTCVRVRVMARVRVRMRVTGCKITVRV